MTRTEKFKLLRQALKIEAEAIIAENEELRKENDELRRVIKDLEERIDEYEENKVETLLDEVSMDDLVDAIFSIDFYTKKEGTR